MGTKKHFKSSEGAIVVRDGNIEQALRVLKKKMLRSGVFKDMRKTHYISKGEQDRLSRQKATSRAFKDAVNRFSRENMVPKAEARKILKSNKPS